MNYYVIELTTYADGTNPAKAIYGPYTKTDAEATFYQKMGGAMKNTNYATESLMVVSETMQIVPDCTKYFNRANEQEAES